MKKTLLPLIILLLASCGGTIHVAEKWENGKDKIVLRIEKGTKEKPEVYYMKSYYPNGNIYKEGMIRDTVEDGIWKTYYATGEIKSKGSFSMGKKVGEYNIYYRDGKVEQTGMYEADSLVEAFLYDMRGQMMKIDSTALWLDTTNSQSKWQDLEYANMHMECNMIFFDNYDKGTQMCSCFLDMIQKKLSYTKYNNLTDRQISLLMKYTMEEYDACLSK